MYIAENKLVPFKVYQPLIFMKNYENNKDFDKNHPQCVIIYSFAVMCLTLKRLGGGPKRPPPPRHFARLLCNAQSSRRDTLWLFSFKFPAHFDTKFVMPGGTVLKLRNFLYMHVGPKMALICDFVYKINANWFFSHSSYKYAYFYSQWLKWICFSIIVLQKVSATNFTEKTTKTKGQKTKKYIRNS